MIISSMMQIVIHFIREVANIRQYQDNKRTLKIDETINCGKKENFSNCYFKIIIGKVTN